MPEIDNKDLKTRSAGNGKPVAIVTAAASGIGAECARELASCGYHISLLDLSSSVIDLAEELGGRGFQGSVTDKADLERLVEQTCATFGRLDAVVINTGHAPWSKSGAGTAYGTGPAYHPSLEIDLTEISDEDWNAGFEMLFMSVVRVLRLVIPIFREKGMGAVVNISTFAAPEPRLTYPVSSAVRLSLSGLMKLYSDRYARHGIRINNVLPGFLENWEQPANVIEAIPMSRRGTLSEVAKVVSFLLSDDAGYITGQNLLVDGGVNRGV